MNNILHSSPLHKNNSNLYLDKSNTSKSKVTFQNNLQNSEKNEENFDLNYNMKLNKEFNELLKNISDSCD